MNPALATTIKSHAISRSAAQWVVQVVLVLLVVVVVTIGSTP